MPLSVDELHARHEAIEARLMTIQAAVRQLERRIYAQQRQRIYAAAVRSLHKPSEN